MLDFKLIEKANKGDEEAKNRLFQNNEKEVKSFLFNKIYGGQWEENVQLPDEFEQFCSNAFCTILKDMEACGNDLDGKEFIFHDHFNSVANKFWDETAGRVNQGDQELIAAFFLMCRKRIYAKLRMIVGPDRADDLSQNAFLKIIENYDQDVEIKKRRRYDQSYSILSHFGYIIHLPNAQKREHSTSGYNIVVEKADIKGKNPKEKIITDIETQKKDSEHKSISFTENISHKNADPESLIVIIEGKYAEIKQRLKMLNFCADKALPHQFFAFGFNKWLGWGPQKVVDTRSNDLFKNLSDEFQRELLKLDSLYEEIDVNGYFLSLNDKLTQKTEKIYNYKALLNDYGENYVADLYLTLFYGKNPKHDIAVWTNRVLKNAKKSFLTSRS